MRNYIQKEKNKIIILACILSVIIISFVLLVSTRYKKSENIQISQENLSDFSSHFENEYILKISLSFKDNNPSVRADNDRDYREFISKNIKIDGKTLFPQGLENNIKLNMQENDKNFSGESIDRIRYYQTINGIQIFGSELSIYSIEGKKIDAITGSLLKDNKVESEKITLDEAKKAALEKAFVDSGESKELSVTEKGKYYFNSSLIGTGFDTKTYPVFGFQIDSFAQGIFSTYYLVSLTSGKILYEETLTPDLKTRNVYDCKNTSNPPCSIARKEGDPAVSDSDTNKSYDVLGVIYDYYFNTFSRDSLDDRGLALNSYVRMYQVDNNGPCSIYKNAAYGSATMYYCAGLVTLDITGHEFTHGVTANEAALVYQNQSGAINEAISDIFASNMDNNWTMGEGSALGVIRSMSDPTSVSRPQPDKLSASRYFCRLDNPADDSDDHGGVHINSGILNKAYFLMTDGGQFNGCSINAVGRERSQRIVYRALDLYLTQTSSFKDAYFAINKSCDDLFSSEPGVCDEVKKAMQATEMDQQPDGTQANPFCPSGAPAPQTPACAGSGAGPTIPITPFPTGTTGSGGGGGASGNYKVSGKVYIDVNNDAKFDSGDSPYKDAILDLSDGPKTGSATTNAAGDYVLSDYPSGLYTITLSILGSKKETRPIVLGPDQSIDFRIFSTKTEPTIVAKPTVKVGPTIGDGPTLTPTPVPHICEFDPKCAAQKKNLQLCKLICRPKT